MQFAVIAQLTLSKESLLGATKVCGDTVLRVPKVSSGRANCILSHFDVALFRKVRVYF